MEQVIKNVFVSIPFTMLLDSYLDIFLEQGLNPEIGLDYPALTRCSMDDFKKIAATFHERNLSFTFHGPFMDISPGSRDDEIRAVARKRFEQVLALIPIFKPRAVVFHPGYDRRHYSWYLENWRERSLEMWSWFSGRVNGEGSRLMLENVYEDRPEDILFLFEALSSKQRVGFCFDMGHQRVFSKATATEWLNCMEPYLGQVHLHDNLGGWDDHMGIGMGDMDFTPLWNHLARLKGRLPVITLEPHREIDLWPSLSALEKLKLF